MHWTSLRQPQDHSRINILPKFMLPIRTKNLAKQRLFIFRRRRSFFALIQQYPKPDSPTVHSAQTCKIPNATCLRERSRSKANSLIMVFAEARLSLRLASRHSEFTPSAMVKSLYEPSDVSFSLPNLDSYREKRHGREMMLSVPKGWFF